jgi:hypothetical protein
LGCPHLQLAKGQALVKTNSPRIRIRPERIAAYLTLISAGLGFFDQVRRTNEQVKVYRERKRRDREGFGFGVKR